jgi:hypothetical protein
LGLHPTSSLSTQHIDASICYRLSTFPLGFPPGRTTWDFLRHDRHPLYTKMISFSLLIKRCRNGRTIPFAFPFHFCQNRFFRLNFPCYPFGFAVLPAFNLFCRPSSYYLLSSSEAFFALHGAGLSAFVVFTSIPKAFAFYKPQIPSLTCLFFYRLLLVVVALSKKKCPLFISSHSLTARIQSPSYILTNSLSTPTFTT